jgi:hypothetical protein
MLKRRTRIRRRLAGLTYEERTGVVCDAPCQAAAQRERAQARALVRRGIIG